MSKDQHNLDNIDELFREFPRWKPNVLYFGPGGAKGIQMVGSLIKIYGEYLTELDTIVGCSAGSIIGMMLCLGYTALEIAKESKDFNLFEKVDVNNLKLLMSQKGLLDPEVTKEKIKDIVIKKMGHNGTLLELYNMCGIEFISVTSVKRMKRSEYVSYKNYPDELISDAVFASMNIPYLFRRSLFLGENCIDGAFTDPLPLHLKDKEDNRVLVICLDEGCNESIADNIIQDIYDTVTLPIITLKNHSINNASNRCRILNMKCNVKDITGITVSQSDKQLMLRDGYEKMNIFLKEMIKEENKMI